MHNSWQRLCTKARPQLAAEWAEAYDKITTPGATMQSCQPMCYLRPEPGSVEEVLLGSAASALASAATGKCALPVPCPDWCAFQRSRLCDWRLEGVTAVRRTFLRVPGHGHYVLVTWQHCAACTSPTWVATDKGCY